MKDRIKLKALSGKANALLDEGSFDAAFEAFGEVVKLAGQLNDFESQTVGEINKGVVLKSQGKLDEALSIFRDQEEKCRLQGYLYGLSLSIGNRGNIHHNRRELEEALACYREMESIDRELGDREALIKSLGNLAAVLVLTEGGEDEAESMVEEALDLYQEQNLPELESELKSFLDQVVQEITLSSAKILQQEYPKGIAAKEKGDYEVSFSIFFKLLKPAHRLYKSSDGHIEMANLLAGIYKNLGELYGEINLSAESIEHLQAAANFGEKVFLNNHHESKHVHGYADIMILLAGQYWINGDLEDAIDQYNKTISMLKSHIGKDVGTEEDRWRLAVCYSNLGILQSEFDQGEQELQHLKMAISILEGLIVEQPKDSAYENLLQRCRTTLVKQV